jgi:hypothetical protein
LPAATIAAAMDERGRDWLQSTRGGR